MTTGLLTLVALPIATAAGAHAEQVAGTDGNDELVGTAQSDRMLAGEGDDSLSGLLGDDFLFGGPGRDWLDGGAGNDSFHGQGGDDEIRGSFGADHTFLSGNGTDRVFGGAQNDVLSNWTDNPGFPTPPPFTGDLLFRGGYGDDVADVVGSGRLELYGEGGADSLIVGAQAPGSSYLFGGPGADVMYAYGEAVAVSGGQDADYIQTRAASPIRITGGRGDDEITAYQHSPGRMPGNAIDCGPGTDLVRAVLGDTVERCESVEMLYAGDGEGNRIEGTGFMDAIEAHAGDDVVATLGGNDYVELGGGDDVVRVGGGNDQVHAAGDPSARDLVRCGAGYDYVVADPSDVVEDGCEEVRIRRR